MTNLEFDPKSVVDQEVRIIRYILEGSDRYKKILHENDGTALSAVMLRICILAVGKERVVSLALPHLSRPSEAAVEAVVADTGVSLVSVPIASTVIELWKHLSEAGIEFDAAMHEELVLNIRDVARLPVLDFYAAGSAVYHQKNFARKFSPEQIDALCRYFSISPETFTHPNA